MTSPAGTVKPPASLDDTLRELLDSHRAGDPHALGKLILAVHPDVHRFVWRLLRRADRDNHADLVQLVLEQLYRTLPRFEGRSKVTTFIFGVAHVVVRGAQRRESLQNKLRRAVHLFRAEEEPSRPDELLESERASTDVHRILDVLSTEERAMMVLHELEGIHIDEIAASFGCSTRTVKRRLKHARQHLIRSAHGR